MNKFTKVIKYSKLALGNQVQQIDYSKVLLFVLVIVSSICTTVIIPTYYYWHPQYGLCLFRTLEYILPSAKFSRTLFHFLISSYFSSVQILSLVFPSFLCSRYRNRYKPPDVLGLSKEKFSSTSINKDTYGGYIPSSSSSNVRYSAKQLQQIGLVARTREASSNSAMDT